jgi:ATP-binding cassette subfamily B (MDR/TAP) protein 1
MLGNMEKTPVEIDASNVAQHESCPKTSQQENDPKPDYSSKATNKTTLTDYLVVFALLG